MTPREKAEHILDECYRLELETVYYGVNHYLAKKFCYITIEAGLEFEKKIVKDVEILCKEMSREFKFEGYFWDEVKHELENIDIEYKKADKLAFESMKNKTNL